MSGIATTASTASSEVYSVRLASGWGIRNRAGFNCRARTGIHTNQHTEAVCAREYRLPL